MELPPFQAIRSSREEVDLRARVVALTPADRSPAELRRLAALAGRTDALVLGVLEHWEGPSRNTLAQQCDAIVEVADAQHEVVLGGLAALSVAPELAAAIGGGLVRWEVLSAVARVADLADDACARVLAKLSPGMAVTGAALAGESRSHVPAVEEESQVKGVLAACLPSGIPLAVAIEPREGPGRVVLFVRMRPQPPPPRRQWGAAAG